MGDAKVSSPAHTDLLGDTDLAIRRVAEAADIALQGSIRFITLNPAQYTINDYGDVLVRFPLVTKPLSGAYIYESTRGSFYSQNRYPSPPPPQIDYIQPLLNAWPIIVNLLPNAGDPGAVFVRLMCSGAEVTGNGTGAWFASGPAKSGQTVWLSGLAWGPA